MITSFVCTGNWLTVSSYVINSKNWNGFTRVPIHLHDVSAHEPTQSFADRAVTINARSGADYGQSVFITYEKLTEDRAQSPDAARNYIIKAKDRKNAVNFDILGMHIHNKTTMIMLRPKDPSVTEMPDDIQGFITQNNLKPADPELIIQQFSSLKESKQHRLKRGQPITSHHKANKAMVASSDDVPPPPPKKNLFERLFPKK